MFKKSSKDRVTLRDIVNKAKRVCETFGIDPNDILRRIESTILVLAITDSQRRLEEFKIRLAIVTAENSPIEYKFFDWSDPRANNGQQASSVPVKRYPESVPHPDGHCDNRECCP